jgi:hypothetical protein
VTRLDQLERRIAILEAAQAARPAKRKRECAPKPDSAVVTKRVNLWARLVLLHVQYGRGRLTKLKVCIKYGLGDPSDLCRFLSADDARGIPEGSIPAVRYYQALREFIVELEARRDSHGSHSHGIHAGSQSLGAQVQ